MSDPAKYSVRTLAELHGLSIARVDAVLRLKGLEEEWRKVSLRSGFVWCRDVARRMSPNRLVFKMPVRAHG